MLTEKEIEDFIKTEWSGIEALQEIAAMQYDDPGEIYYIPVSFANYKNYCEQVIDKELTEDEMHQLLEAAEEAELVEIREGKIYRASAKPVDFIGNRG